MKEKYSLIIVDDESHIIDLVKKLVKWDELGITFCSAYSNGKDALEGIIRNRPDIVITDVKMPEYDGIQMIERVRAAGIDAQFVMISGYKNFEYAKSAIRLGVSDYLLKPLDGDQINQTLQHVCAKVDESRYMMQERTILQKYVDDDQKSKHDRVWKDLIAVPESFRDMAGDWGKFSRIYGLQFQPESYRVYLITTNVDGSISGNQEFFSDKMTNIIVNTVKGNASYLLANDSYSHFLLLADADESHGNRLISSVFYAIKNLSEIYGRFDVNIGCSLEKHLPEEMPAAYHEAVLAEMSRMVFMGNKVISYEDVTKLRSIQPEAVLSRENEEKAGKAILRYQYDELSDIFATMDRVVLENSNMNPEAIFSSVERIIRLADEKIEQKPEDRDKFREQYSIVFLQARNYDQLIKGLFQCLVGHMKELQDSILSSNTDAIQNAVAYIQDHLKDPLSLKEVVDHYGFSYSYFSKLFKKEIGMGFEEYVISKRLEKAKELLTTTQKNVKEIAAETGYTEVKYFSKQFKKEYGLTPKEYRKLCGPGDRGGYARK